MDKKTNKFDKVDNNFITIFGWMRNKLNLKGKEVDCFALIYGFNQDGRTKCNCGYNYMALLMACTRRSAINHVGILFEMNYIDVVAGETNNEYTINHDLISKIKASEIIAPPRPNKKASEMVAPPLVKEIHYPSETVAPLLVKPLHVASEMVSPNNIINSNSNNITDSITNNIPNQDLEIPFKKSLPELERKYWNLCHLTNEGKEKVLSFINKKEFENLDQVQFIKGRYKKSQIEGGHFLITEFSDSIDYNIECQVVINLLEVKEKELLQKEKISAKKEKELLIQQNAISIIDSLNGLTGRDYSKNVSGRDSKNVRSVIKILKKGYSFDEVNDMVIFKCWEWLNNSKMTIYLQPSTLFGGKHETYIEQAKIAKENPAFVEAMKKAKESENKGKPLQGGTITNQAENTLKNW